MCSFCSGYGCKFGSAHSKEFKSRLGVPRPDWRSSREIGPLRKAGGHYNLICALGKADLRSGPTVAPLVNSVSPGPIFFDLNDESDGDLNVVPNGGDGRCSLTVQAADLAAKNVPAEAAFMSGLQVVF